MSHGHNHEEYRQEALKLGGTPNASKGLTVLCDGEAPKSGASMKVFNRFFCIVGYHGSEICGTCEHSRFVLRFQARIGDQVVACPRWKSLDDKLDRKKPFYVHQRREICLTQRPFDYCSSCQNQRPQNPPENKEGWWEEERARHGTVLR